MTRATTFRATAVIGGALLAMLMIMTVSRAAFSDTTSNPDNAWDAGTVVLTDNHQSPATAMFDEGPLKPGDSGSACIGVIYNGTVESNVVLSAIDTAGSTGLEGAIDVVIDKSDGSTCGNGTTTPVYTGGLDAFSGDTGHWTASSAGTTYYYNVAWTFTSTGTNAGDNMLQGLNATAAFTWTATSN
jgi:hypothetical protein